MNGPVQGTASPLAAAPIASWRTRAVRRFAASAAYDTLADVMRALSDGAWWHAPLIRPGPLAAIVILTTTLSTLRTALLLALLLQLGVMGATLGSRAWRRTRLQRVARAMARLRGAQRGTPMTSWRRWSVSAHTRRQVERLRHTHDGEVVIGRIDRWGRVLGLFGPLPGMPAVSGAEFSPGRRFRLDVVLIEDHVLIRKDFHGDRHRFYAEWSTLTYLQGRAHVPAIHHVDERRGIIYKDLITGRTIRDLLVAAGGPDGPAGQAQARPPVPKRRKRALEAHATSMLSSTLPGAVPQEVERQLGLIHDSGVTGVSHTFQNVVLEEASGTPWFIDCENGRIHGATSGWRFTLLREYERIRFAQRYGRALAVDGPDAAPLRADPEAARPRA